MSDVTKELTQAIDKLKRGNNRTPVLSPQHSTHAIQEAWVICSLHLGYNFVRSGGIVQALLDNEALRGVILESAPSLLKLPREKNAGSICKGAVDQGVVGRFWLPA